VLKHILTPTQSTFLQPFQPQVFLFSLSRPSTLRPFEAAIVGQSSPCWVWYTKQDPSEFGFGLVSGKVPRPQHTIPPGCRVEQRELPALNFVKSAGVMPHLDARELHESPDSILRVWQVPSELGGGEMSGSVPEEQQTALPTVRVERKLLRVLYSVKSL